MNDEYCDACHREKGDCGCAIGYADAINDYIRTHPDSVPEPHTVRMPYELPASLLKAVAEHQTTRADTWEETHRRVGWLVYAWEVMKATQQ